MSITGIFKAGRLFVRREPQDDAGDVVRVCGITPQYIGAEFIANRLVVEAAEYGAVPDDWDASRVMYDVEDFTADYREANPAEVAALAVEQAADAKAATAASAKRQSPWAYGAGA